MSDLEICYSGVSSDFILEIKLLRERGGNQFHDVGRIL